MTGFSTTFSFNSIESDAISNEKGNFSEIYIDGSFPYGEVGSPSLPMITRLIAIPQGATPVVTVNGYSENEYSLEEYDINTLSAQQAPVRKNIDPTTVEYVVNDAAYARDTYTTDEIASIEDLGTMRGIRIGRLTIRPVAYNAVAKTVKVYNDVNVTVNFENANAALTQSMFASTYSPAFNSIYDQLFNKSIFGQTLTRDAYSDHPDVYNTPVRMLVICYSGFRGNSSLNQWLQWKLQKGYYVDIFYTDETGTTASSIKSFIQTKYNASVSAGNAYTYLIVIGDTGQVPQYMTKTIDSDIGECASDLGYAAVNFTTSSTTNYFPDMFYSRISVENTTHLANYIDKVITYEKYEMTDGGDYLNNLILVGGWDSSWTSRVARPTVNYGSTNYFNTSNTTYGGFENGTLNITISNSSTAGYSGTNNGCYNGINNGVGFLNYTAHGDKQEWYQPKLTAAHVATLTNSGKYFFGVGNCCLTGNFNNTTTTYSPGSNIGNNACFAEAMIRVPKAGAVAYVGCSPYSYWYEDFYWAVGAHTYSQGNAPSTSASTMGVYDAMFVDEYWNSASSLLYLGNLAVQQAVTNGNQNSSATDGDCRNSAHYYFQFYHTFGDGSVMPYITKPEVNNVSHPASVMAGATSITVNAVAGSYVAVTDSVSTIYGVAVANASGVANVSLSNVPSVGNLFVVVTRQQYQPYFGTVSVITPNPPVADFTGTPTTILERESVTFTNNSQYAATCQWNFGDGQTSTEMNPVHTYMTPGTYTVTLRVENTLGNDTKTRTDYITVNPNTNPPVADFVASETEVSMGTTVNFTDLTENIPTSWEWTFEGGSPATSTDQNPSVLYSESGTYTVTLVAHNAYGSDTETKTGYITVFYPDVVMSNETVYVCAGTYKDPGGDGDYANSLSYTQTLYPSTEGAKVRLTFTEFSLEAASSWGNSCYDKFYIYDGTSASGTALVNGVCGTSNPGTVTATNADGALTIMFTSDNSDVSSGWVAEISCYVPGPEVEVQSYTPTTANYNTTNDLNVVFTNTGVGSTGANTTATISTTDEYLTLNSTSAILGAIARNATANGTFNFSLAENVPNGHVATINVVITDESSTWNETITITAVGPACDAPTGLQVAVNNTDATITWDTQTIEAITISDDFEGHEAFTINSPGTVGWTYIDGDGSPTGGINGYTLTNSGSEMAFIVVDPTQVPYTNNTSQNLASRAGVTAHSGTKFIASFFNVAQNNVTLQNDDWIVSPELNFAEDFAFSFYCRGGHRSSNTSYTETYEVYYSTTTNDESAFTNLLESTTVTGGNNVQWTSKTYTVPSSAKYVAIKYASNDKYYFCVDDITISGNAISGAAAVNIYDNGVLVASNVTGGTYTASNLSVGEHCFSVRAVCNDDSESLAAQQCVNVESSLPSYTVAVNANNGGSVNPNGTQTVIEGNNFTFTVTPENCYEIGNVTVNGTTVALNANNQYTINNITANQTVNVTFNPISYTIAATAGNGGSISPAGNTSVTCGGNQTFAIAANNGYRIVDVTVDGQSQGAIESYTFSNVTADHTIAATFIAVLNINIDADAEGGSVSPTGTQTLDAGESFTFTVTPEPCYEIGSVTVNGTAVTLNANNQYTITNITANQNINVTFNQITYTIAATAGNGGSITPAGNTTVNCGESQAYTITAADGYMIEDVLVDGQSVGAVASYTFSNVTEGHSINATFSLIPPDEVVIVVNAEGDGGTVTPNGSTTITEGEDFTFYVTPDNCHTVGTVTVNGTEVALDANNSYTIHNVTTEQNVNVTFSLITYTITATAGNGGSITPAGNTTVNCGENQTYTIAATEGYMIDDVTVDGQSVGAVTSYTFSNVTEDHSINATFSLIPPDEFVINIDADANGGTVTPNGTQTITEGEDFTFYVTPDNCHTVGTVTVNGTEVALDANNSYTIENVTEEQNVNVTFNQVTYTIAASAGNGGTISPAGDVTVNCGADAVFTITPDEGYEIADVTVDGQSAINDIANYAVVGAGASYTFSNVSENGHSIYVTFSLIPVETCYAVENLEVAVEPYGNVISWTAAENAVSYNIFRNDETSALANVPSTTYVDMNGNVGDRYYVVTVCQFGESEASEIAEALPSSIDENSISVELYPNPTDGKFMIECNEMTTVEIFNMVGQSIGMIEVNSDTVSIDASTWTSGVYNVRITTGNTTTIVKQIIKQ